MRRHLRGQGVVALLTAQLDKLMPIKAPPDTSKYLLCPDAGPRHSIDVAEGI